MNKQKILEVLRGTKPANPMSFDVIQYKTDISIPVLEKLLFEMCAERPAPIEREIMKRGGKEQFYYWPTGVVSHPKTEKPAEPKPQEAAISTTQASGARVISPVPTQSIATNMADKAIVKVEKATMTKPQDAAPAKSKVGTMLEMIADRGFCSDKELCRAVETNNAKVFLAPYLNKKLIVGSEGENGRIYRLALGVKKEDLFRRPLVKPAPEAETELAPAPVTDDTALSPLSDALCAGQFSITPDGEILILQSGFIQHQFPLETAIQLKRFLNAIDLESLCA